jgi:hypothetical protein
MVLEIWRSPSWEKSTVNVRFSGDGSGSVNHGKCSCRILSLTQDFMRVTPGYGSQRCGLRGLVLRRVIRMQCLCFNRQRKVDDGLFRGFVGSLRLSFHRSRNRVRRAWEERPSWR